jgi:hypothetical protein
VEFCAIVRTLILLFTSVYQGFLIEGLTGALHLWNWAMSIKLVQSNGQELRTKVGQIFNLSFFTKVMNELVGCRSETAGYWINYLALRLW